MKRAKIVVGALCAMALVGCGQVKENEIDKEVEPPTVSTEKMVALSFDDGPNTTTTVEILNILKDYDVPATFFVIGSNITEESGPVLKQIVEQGCEIGNHSQNHSHMEEMTVDELKSEVSSVQESVKSYTNVTPTLFRPPYLTTSQMMFDNIDMTFIGGYDTGDYDASRSAQDRADAVLTQAKDGAIFIMHCFKGNTATAEALDIIIPELQRMGYKLVTVGELLKAKGVALESNSGKMYYDATIVE